MKILYVEDDRINAMIMKKILEERHEVALALTSDEAIRVIEQEAFDLYLLDINLGHPEVSGLELCQMIRQQKNGPQRIIAVTAYSEPEDRSRFLEAGFDYYFSKPVKFGALQKFVNDLKIPEPPQ